MSKKVSIIMPVYNVEKYLVQAMESAVNQDYDNYEIVCIDDGSTDGSKEILDTYTKYDFVKVIHKQNTGYGNSMNIGLNAATGEYISILEPDDYIATDTLSSIMKIIEKEGDLDFVKCDFAFVKGEKDLEIIPAKIVKNDSLYGKVLEGEDILELYLGYIAHWTSIYNRKFLFENNIRYNETPGASYQDIGLWFQSLMSAKKAYLLNRYFYHYRADNPGSSMNNPGKVFCTCEEYDFIEKKLDAHRDQDRLLPYYTKCRLIAAKDTYRRIANDYRKDFLIRVGSDFTRLKREGKLNVTKLSDGEMHLLVQLLDSPENVWNIKNAECQKFGERIEETESFYIYGAGNLAQFIYRLLSDEERAKLVGFVVTATNGEKHIADKPVYEFKNIKEELIGSQIIIGVSELYEDEICAFLNENGLKDYFVFKGGIV